MFTIRVLNFIKIKIISRNMKMIIQLLSKKARLRRCNTVRSSILQNIISIINDSTWFSRVWSFCLILYVSHTYIGVTLCGSKKFWNVLDVESLSELPPYLRPVIKINLGRTSDGDSDPNGSVFILFPGSIWNTDPDAWYRQKLACTGNHEIFFGKISKLLHVSW